MALSSVCSIKSSYSLVKIKGSKKCITVQSGENFVCIVSEKVTETSCNGC